MTELEDPWSGAEHWYPDVVAAGSATRAWQAELDHEVHPRDSVQGPHRSATAANGDRIADLVLGRQKREFFLSLRLGGSRMLQGRAPDLTTTAAPARQWLAGARPGEIAAAWPFLGSVALAEARE